MAQNHEVTTVLIAPEAAVECWQETLFCDHVKHYGEGRYDVFTLCGCEWDGKDLADVVIVGNTD